MTAFITDPDGAPYNVAHLVDDRSYLYREYDVDHDQDDGRDAAERDAPLDYAARREAILAFYGGRCGRCGTAVDTQSGDDTELGYVYSVAADDDPEWQLSSLVALCEPCYDLLSAETCSDVGTFGDAYRRAPQFPTWTCDPRVAVERLPLSGREVWLRSKLADRIADAETPECTANRRVARRACLARRTHAAEAVALGEALVRDECGTLSTTHDRLRDRFDHLAETDRERWEARAVDPDTSLVTGPFEPALVRDPV